MILPCRGLRESLEVLLARYSVDMTWAGHVHNYQRSCPVYKNTCVGYYSDGTAKAPVHLVVGNAGFMSQLTDSYEQRPPWMEKFAFVSALLLLGGAAVLIPGADPDRHRQAAKTRAVQTCSMHPALQCAWNGRRATV